MRPFVALGELGLLAFRTARAGARRGVPRGELWQQLHDMANRTAWLVTFGCAFFGAVMVVIADGQVRRFVGSLELVGPAYVELLVREFGPMIVALLAAARIGGAHSAELSQMSVNEQLEALEMSAGDPLADLVAPRVLAAAVALPVLTVLGVSAAVASAAFTARVAFSVDPFAFLNTQFVDGADVLSAFLKALACGLYIPFAVAWKGLDVRGGSEAVGRATTEGVVAACFGCMALDFGISLAFLVGPS